MVSDRVRPVKLHVREMREPGQRMPIAGGFGLESPAYALGRQPVLNRHSEKFKHITKVCSQTPANQSFQFST